MSIDTKTNPEHELEAERAIVLAESIEVEGPKGAILLSDLMTEIIACHKELSDHKQRSLLMRQVLKERTEEAREDGDDEAIELLESVYESAHAIGLRVERGDAELRGDRDGPHSGAFKSASD